MIRLLPLAALLAALLFPAAPALAKKDVGPQKPAQATTKNVMSKAEKKKGIAEARHAYNAAMKRAQLDYAHAVRSAKGPGAKHKIKAAREAFEAAKKAAADELKQRLETLK